MADDPAVDPKVSITDDGEVYLSGVNVAGDRRTVADLLHAVDKGAYVLRPNGLRLGAVPQRLLYRSYRDVCPSRISAEGRRVWRADVVVYSGGVLPTGELCRSIGHRNLPDEWELFAVERGAMAMVLEEDRQLSLIERSAGEYALLAPDTWHCTYVLLTSPSVISNIYCDSTTADPSLHAAEKKYERRVGDGPSATLQQTVGANKHPISRYRVVGDDRAHLCDLTSMLSARDESVSAVLAGRPLLDWFSSCASEELDQLVDNTEGISQ